MPGKAILKILTRDRSRNADTCRCADCTAAVNQASCYDGFECKNCGYRGVPVALACCCYDHSCRGGEHAGAGCPHGALMCPVCLDGEDNIDGWALIREINQAIRRGDLAS